MNPPPRLLSKPRLFGRTVKTGGARTILRRIPIRYPFGHHLIALTSMLRSAACSGVIGVPEPVAPIRQIRGDLDSITHKALEKDRKRRYGSPSDFAADLGRYLRNETVQAVPPSFAYLARKFAGRHRAALAIVAAFVLVLVAATVILIRQGIRANREPAVVG